MKKIIIKANEAGQRIDKFMFKMASNLTNGIFHKAARNKDILLNKRKITGSEILQTGDIVEYYLHSKFFEPTDNSFLRATDRIKTIFEDSNVIIVHKPVGVLIHKSEKSDYNDLTSQMLLHLYENNEYDPDLETSFTPAFINRLDRNTEGLVIAAKNFPTLQLLSLKVKQREIRRKYLCIVNGKPLESHRKLTGYLLKDEAQNKAFIFKEEKPNSLYVETDYTVIENYNNNTSLLEVELITGRFHQIRAHLSTIGHPIVGDRKYGDTSRIKFQQLVSFYIEFDFKQDNQHLEYLKGQAFSITPDFHGQ